jgi:hypothetical protein
MKLTISTVALVALAATVGAATAGVSQDRIPDAQRPGAIEAPASTLTGCVARGTATDTYTLAEAKKDAAAAPATAAPAELVALAGTDVDLSKHVGHGVTVTGSYTGNPSFDESPTRLLFAAVLHKPAAPHAVLATVQRVAGLSGFGGTHGR